MKPVVSVIIPAYNAAKTLPAAVESVRRQHVENMEVIVVDDGSTDDTHHCCRHVIAPVEYIFQRNQGVSAARNAGLRAAQGDFIAFLDADDEWPDGSLAQRLEVLQGNDSLLAVQGLTSALRQIEGAGVEAEAVGAPWFAPLLGSTLFRSSIFGKVGYFDEALRTAEDLDWFIRAREAGHTVAQLPFVALHYYLHAGSLTRGLDPRQKNLMLVLKRSLDRRLATAAARQQS